MHKFSAIIERLRDGKGYRFGHAALKGHFYKARYPARDADIERDEAASAITFWHTDQRASPTLMLYDFDDPVWWIEQADTPF